jgi:hypothetical protein
MVNLKQILLMYKDKKVKIYTKNFNKFFQGTLADISEEFIVIKSKYKEIIYILLSEIVAIVGNL